MKRFLKYIICFFLPILLLLCTGEYLVRNQDNAYKYKHKYMKEKGSEVEIIVLGSSHSFYGIKPGMLSNKAFSLANPSQTTEYDVFVLENYVNTYQNLKLVIMPISYFTFFDKPLQETTPYRAMFYKLYMKASFPKELKYDFEFASMSTFKEKLKKSFSSSERKEYDEYAWGSLHSLKDKDLNTWQTKKVEQALWSHTAKDFSQESRNYKNVEEIVKFCIDRKIRIVLLTTPCWHTYYEKINPKQMQETYELVNQLVRRYGIEYFDYMKDKRFYKEMYFYDGDHLSEIGAKKFSLLLKQDLGL
ncbi:MAG: hypothetical protein Q4Q06_07370 [Bacteroidota bacterium]|nr:hypothetical protein [Bacteroidota bacterium]